MNSGSLARLILIALVCLLLSAAPVSAQTTRSANSHATLVSAINAANTSSGDTINITSNITLTADLPAITKSVTINGNNNTINGADSHRAFDIDTSGISVTINNLTLANNQSPDGKTGGAINLPGGTQGTASLTLNNVTVRDSSAWYDDVQRNGGGLYCNSTSLRIVNSRFYNNRGNEGGAISIGSVCNATITRSAFYNNRARLNGGAMFIGKNAKVTISHSSIYGNITGDSSGDGRGSALYILGGSGSLHRDIYLNHLTITGNQNSESNDKRASDAAVQIVLSNAKVHIRNSIIYGNNTDATTPGVDCSRTSPARALLTDSASALDSNVGNIIGDGNCGTPSGVFGPGGNPQLPASASSGYFALSQSSPAVDGAACISGLNQDQRGRPRRSGVRCDIGAYEYQYPPPPPSDFDEGGSPDAGDQPADRDRDQQAAKPALSTCLTLAGIAAYNLSESTQCQRVDAMQIANPTIKEGDFVDAVDVWSWVTPDTQICFEAAGGAFKFINTAVIPRTIQDWPAFARDGMTCASIDGPGILILMPGDPPEQAEPDSQPASQQQPLIARRLQNCMVTANASLNLRVRPHGRVYGGVAKGWTLTATARTDDWFQVDRLGQSGWIAAMYVTPEGDCD